MRALSERETTACPFERDAAGKPILALDPTALYAFGHLIRGTEQLVLDQFGRGLVSGTTHTCLGQELCQMAVVRALTDADDAVFSNHRNHGHFLTYSGDFVGLVAEIMGRDAGVCGGRGGSQHIAHRHFHSNGVQAGMSAIGVGTGLALKIRNSLGIVATIVGDGTLGEGLLYESLNLASIWQVPVLFVVENNGIAQTTDTSETVAGGIEERGHAFGLTTWRYGDDDPALFELVEQVVDEVRASRRPGLLVLDSRRLGPHSKGDDLRDEAELAAIRRRDPLTALGERLAGDLRAQIERRNSEFLAEVRERAEASPEARQATPPRHIFGAAEQTTQSGRVSAQRMPNRKVRASLNDALRALLTSSDQTILLGEDLHDPYGGAFKVTAGLSSDFSGRVVSTPISEAAITGAGIGLAMAGFRPIVEVMFADFLTLCADQIYNHAVKFPAMFPDVQVPLVIRTPSGGRRGYGPTHSQSPENLFTSVPGLTVVYGSHRHEVDHLLIDATRAWPYPVLFLEHKLLYGEVQDPDDYDVVVAGAEDPGAKLFPTIVRRQAERDITIITYGGMLPLVEQVAARLEDDEELAVEIVAPSLLAPFPRTSLVEAVGSSPRVAVVEESHDGFGVSAEVLASLLEAGYAGRAVRIGTPPVPILSARSLESQILPTTDRIIETILELF